MHVPGQSGGTAIAADLGRRQCVGLIVGAEAAVLLGNGDAEQAGAVQVPVILGREFCVAIIGRGAAGEYALAKFPCGSNNRRLFVIQPERGGVEDRRIRIERIDIGRAFTGLQCHHAVTCVAAIWAIRKESSAALKASGRSRLARWPTPSSSTYFADGI